MFASSGKVTDIIRAYGTVVAMLVIIIIFSIARPDAFFTWTNFINISRQISLLVITALGATLVMSVGEFDLSIGAQVSLGGVLAALMAVAGIPIILCFTVPVLVNFIVGYVNGWIVTRFKVLSFITTLGLGTVIGGFTFWLTGGATVFQNIPPSFSVLGGAGFLGFPALSIIMIILVAIFWFIMRHTAFGRKLYAIGGNEAASAVSGLNIRANKNLAFALCGALTAVTGVLMASRLGSAHPTGGDGFFLQSYAAVYLGSTLSKHGAPNIIGTLIGAAILGILANGLTILQVPSFVQNILTGCIIITAVVAQKLGQGNTQ